MSKEKKNEIITSILARVECGFDFITDLLWPKKNHKPDTARIRSYFILLSFHFEILLKAQFIAQNSFKNERDLNLRLQKMGHNIGRIGQMIGKAGLKKLDIKRITSGNGEYRILMKDGGLIMIKDLTDIRYDFISGVVRNVQGDENLRILQSVENAQKIIKKIEVGMNEA